MPKTIIKRQTVLGTIWAYLGVVIGTITQAFIIPNYLTTAENGLLAMLMSWMMILTLLGGLGFTAAGTKFFDRFRNEKNFHNGFLNYGLSFSFLGLLLISLLLIIFRDQIIATDLGDNTLFEAYYYLIIPLTVSTVIFNLFDNYAKGLYDTIAGSFLSQFLQRLLVLITVVLYATKFITLNQFVFSWVIAISIPGVLMALYAKALPGFSLKASHFLSEAKLIRPFYTFAGFSIVTGLSSIIITKLDTLMVYQYLGLSNTGIYNTCLFFGSVMTISYNINIKASSAIVLDAMSQGDFNKVRNIFTKSSLTQLIFGTALLSVVWVNIDDLFSFIKPEYSAGKYVLLIIGIAKLYDLASGINTLILGYSEHYKYDSVLVISFVGLLFLLNHILIPRFGMNGAAIAALIATIYYNSIRNFLIWRFFRIHPYSWSLLVILALGISVTAIGSYFPSLGVSIINRLATVTYKSLVILSLFSFIIFKLNISDDLNKLLRDLRSRIH